ncbi:MAG: phage terminase large subunit [Geminicoccaceae bacterium]
MPGSKLTDGRDNLSFQQFVWLWNRSQGQRTPKLHLDIAIWLGQRWRSGDRRLLLLCFRSAGKSTLIGMFCAWLLLNQPDLRILILSAEYDLAKKMVRNVKNIVERHPLTTDLIPDRSLQWASDQFTVRRKLILRDPSLLARGVTSNITGSRADIVICDDVEVPNTCRTPTKREELRDRLHEISYVLVPGGLQLYAGTPHSLNSIYVEKSTDHNRAVFLDAFERLVIPLLDEAGKSRWPERYPQSCIDDLKRQTGPAKFQSQMMLQPSENEDVRLDPRTLIRYDDQILYRESNGHAILAIGGRRMASVAGWWDPSYGSPDRGDSSVVAAVFLDDDGGYWLHDIRYLLHDPNHSEHVDEATQLCRQVVEFARELHLPSITIETNGLGRFLPAVLRREFSVRGYGCSVLEHASHRSKDERILDAFDPVLAAGALRAHERVWRTPFIDEMRDWRPGRRGRDDGLDAVSACILTEPVRLRRPPAAKGRSWRHQLANKALEIDFTP